MGIRGLGHFVQDQGLLKPTTISNTDRSQALKVIIDGNSLVWHLFRQEFDWVLGGQYTAFCESVLKYVGKLERAGVQICKIVFDGGRGSPAKAGTRLLRDSRKIQDILSAMIDLDRQPLVHLLDGYPVDSATRARRYIGDYASVLPLFAIHHIVCALKMAGFKVQVARCEADACVASWSSKYGACIIGRDSDYLVYNVPGYIPLDSIEFRGFGQSEHVLYKKYNVKDLAGHFKLPVQLLPVLACAAGNDYVGPAVLGSALYKCAGVIANLLTQDQKIQTAGRELYKAYSWNSLAKTSRNSKSGSLTCTPTPQLTDFVPHVFRYIKSCSSTGRGRGAKSYCSLDITSEGNAISQVLEGSRQYECENIENANYEDPDFSNLDGQEEQLYSQDQAKERCQLREKLARGEMIGLLWDVLDYSVMFCSPTLEDASKESVWTASRVIRQCAYGKYGLHKVAEKGRFGIRELDITTIHVEAIDWQESKVWQNMYAFEQTAMRTCPNQSMCLVLSLHHLLGKDDRIDLKFIVAAAIAHVCPVATRQINSLLMSSSLVHAFGMLECTILSMHMLTEYPISFLDSTGFYHYWSLLNDTTDDPIQQCMDRLDQLEIQDGQFAQLLDQALPGEKHLNDRFSAHVLVHAISTYLQM